MKTVLQILESFRFAWKALRANLLRTILSLLGVTIGIFAIIAVLTLVDSLEKNIKDSLDFLGTGVIYVEKWPFLPEAGEEYKWWDFLGRPNTSYSDYRFLSANLKHQSSMAIFARRGDIIVKRGNNSIGDIDLAGGSEGVLGYEVAQTLFPNNQDPIGGEVKIRNLKYRVVGVVEREGQSFLGTPSNDYTVIVPYQSFRKLFLTGTGRRWEISSRIGVKGREYDIGLVELENEIRGLLRVRRGLTPKAPDNFALNRPEALLNVIGSLFDVVSIAGWIIGGFSILVGGFGIANIMFVSVKERTSIIGLQKSLGAKNYFILFQFLFEAIFLSLIGGLAGLFMVYLITFIPLGSLEVALTINNIVLGLGVASTIGIASGFVPALMAARMDPVEALRS